MDTIGVVLALEEEEEEEEDHPPPHHPPQPEGITTGAVTMISYRHTSDTNTIAVAEGQPWEDPLSEFTVYNCPRYCTDTCSDQLYSEKVGLIPEIALSYQYVPARGVVYVPNVDPLPSEKVRIAPVHISLLPIFRFPWIVIGNDGRARLMLIREKYKLKKTERYRYIENILVSNY